MIQNLLLGTLVSLCILLIISLIKKPFDSKGNNPCGFKLLPPRFIINESKKIAIFNIIVEKRHKYFINFPLLFRFSGDQDFRADVKIFYSTPGEEPNMVLDKQIEYKEITKEYIIYITDVILGKITIELQMDMDYGDPIVSFEVMENSTCSLYKEHKLEIIFPK
jgi:hypothetical protein